ncbi:probable inactive receptor kinase At5g58300 [Rhododendron vialii]|uniref:probable inactive receptor kinase At5g58300 n=1 Tax=Rhododendron vialii TaxID=182163 RepID=UPI00265DB26A|nr:probable inactive receptor kinase At5g58300 [Rhododendron vialii]
MLLPVWPDHKFWYILGVISSPSWFFSLLAMDFFKKTSGFVFTFLISALVLLWSAGNFVVSKLYFSLRRNPKTVRFFRNYQRAGKIFGYALLYFGNVGLYYFSEKSVASILTFLFLALYCLCTLFCIQPYTDFGTIEFLLSASMNQTLSLFGLRSLYSWLVIIACIVIAGIRYILEPAHLPGSGATGDEDQLGSGQLLPITSKKEDPPPPSVLLKEEPSVGSGVPEPEKTDLVFFEGSPYSFYLHLEDLLRASAEVLGRGSYGSAYKVMLEDGSTLVVKRLKEVVVGEKEFEHQMEIIGSVGRHPNVLPLQAYYYSKDEKLLVSDYIQGGSLYALLHGNRDDAGRTPLDWESRFKISLGTAEGIAHIHSVGGPKFTHGNIKSSNILLSQDTNACVSDFGLSPLMSFRAGAPRNGGYRAPEVNETQKQTHKSDVYSFGVLLLEMLTGKQPGDMVDLPTWVQSVVREERTADVFDVALTLFQSIQEDMVQLLQIGMACTEMNPDNRPSMEEVVRMIEEIQPSDL